ncbi:MAG: class I SAM-dependent methyltransferase [Pleurocapsa sp.]
MNNSDFSSSRQLYQIVLERIKDAPQQRITFAEYMDLVLYHPDYGYYSSGVIKIGAEGDFFTSSSLGKDLGELLAIQFVEMWQHLHCPSEFFLIEMGAGTGILAADILAYIQKQEPDFSQALKYIIIESSNSLKLKQQEILKDFHQFNLSWSSLTEITQESITGCFFSNELVDAFPVHLVTLDGKKLQEIYLTEDCDQLTEITAEISTPKLLEYLDLVKINLLSSEYSPNYRTEINLPALDWLAKVASKLDRGYVLTIDYGYLAHKYYHPQRSQGTLQCYYRHRRHANPYVNLGYQDLTTHVDFTALERHGESCGLSKIGFTQQGMFLMALGLGDRLNELSSGKYDLLQILQRRDALHQLIDPTGLGGFGVLIQGKGLNDQQKFLKGLTIPPL